MEEAIRLSKDRYTVEVEENRIVFSGELHEKDHKDVDNFLRIVTSQIDAEQIIIDITKLNYANSNAITIIAKYVINRDRKFEIIGDEKITWQMENIPAIDAILRSDDAVDEDFELEEGEE